MDPIQSSLTRLVRWGWRWKTNPAADTGDIGLLVLRLVAGGFMASHGWGKLTSYSERVHTWADPIGLGSEVSLTLAVGAELVCAVLVAVGFLTRGAAIPVMVTMFVAGFVVHWDDPFGRKELALLFLVCYTTLMLTGAGRYSIDGWLTARRDGNKESHG